MTVKDLGKYVYFVRVRQLEKGADKGEPVAGPWSEVLQVEVYGSPW